MGFLFVVMALRILQKKRHLARGRATDIASSGTESGADGASRTASLALTSPRA